MKMEQTECSEMSAYKIQTPGNYPEESIQQQFPALQKPPERLGGPPSLLFSGYLGLVSPRWNWRYLHFALC